MLSADAPNSPSIITLICAYLGYWYLLMDKTVKLSAGLMIVNRVTVSSSVSL